jgi:hypothetical protein
MLNLNMLSYVIFVYVMLFCYLKVWATFLFLYWLPVFTNALNSLLQIASTPGGLKMALPASMTQAVGGADRVDGRRNSGGYESGKREEDRMRGDLMRGGRAERSSASMLNADGEENGYEDEDIVRGGTESALPLPLPLPLSAVDAGGVDMDDDEVLRILSLLEGEGDGEGVQEGDGEGDDTMVEAETLTEAEIELLRRSIAADDAEDWREERGGSDLDPARQLQQRLKKAYSRSKNNRGRGGSTIGADVFEVVDSSSRVRDIRKSRLSSPPPSLPSSRSIFSAPLTETTAGSRNLRSTVPVAGGALTVAEALEALKRPFPSPQKDRTRGGGGVSFSQPIGAVFDTNTRLRTMAESPSGTSYSGEEIDRAIR